MIIICRKLIFLISFLLGFPLCSFAQQVQSPASCVLDHIQNTSPDFAGVLRYNCVQLYIESEERNLVEVSGTPPESLAIEGGALNYFPGSSSVGTSTLIEPHIQVSIYNNTSVTIVSGFVHIRSKSAKDIGEFYRMLADYPISPSTVGYLTADVLESARSQADFANLYTFEYTGFQGVPKAK